MSVPLIIVVTMLYTGISVSLLVDGRHGLALMFFCYALANIGVIWSMK